MICKDFQASRQIVFWKIQIGIVLVSNRTFNYPYTCISDDGKSVLHNGRTLAHIEIIDNVATCDLTIV